MIVNQTVLTEADQDFIRAQLRKHPVVIIVRIIALAAGGYLLFAGGLVEYCWLFRRPKWLTKGDLVAAGIFLGLGILLVYRALFLKQITRRKDRKVKSLTVPRFYTLDETGITVHHDSTGLITQTKYPYENAECFWAADNAVYLRVCGEEKKQKRYMCFHDDGYSEGSREELLRLLEERNITKKG